MNTESMFENYHLAKPIDESRFNEVIYSHHEYRFFSKNTLGEYAKRHLIYEETENKITLITKEKSEWTTDLDCDVEDYEISYFYKSKESLRNSILKTWDKHIELATKERDTAINRFDRELK